MFLDIYFLQQPAGFFFAKRSFSYLAPEIWNNMPLDIRLEKKFKLCKNCVFMFTM